MHLFFIIEHRLVRAPDKSARNVFTIPFNYRPPPPDKADNSRLVHFRQPLQLISPDHNHMKGQTGHFYLFSGQIFEKIAQIINLFPPTFASTTHSHVKWEITRTRLTVNLPQGVFYIQLFFYTNAEAPSSDLSSRDMSLCTASETFTL